jgi:hypothetical protein
MLSFIERTGLAEYTCVTFVPGLDHGSRFFFERRLDCVMVCPALSARRLVSQAAFLLVSVSPNKSPALSSESTS